MRLKLTGCFLAATLAVSYNAFAQYGGIASNLYENARRGNYGAIQRVIDSGYSIDTTDANGNTALCMALMTVVGKGRVTSPMPIRKSCCSGCAAWYAFVR